MDAQRLRRLYASSDSFMLQAARTIHALLSQDLPAFKAFDTGFTADYLNDFEDLINAAEALASDDLVIDQVAAKYEVVENVKTEAESKYTELRYFVLQAFPRSQGVQNQFGMGNYGYTRRTPARMLRLMQDLHKVATSYQAELLSVGCTLDAIAEIDTIGEQLENAISAHSLARKERPKTTAERVSAMNACYERMMQINTAAQIVYMHDSAKRKQYTFYPPRGKAASGEQESAGA